MNTVKSIKTLLSMAMAVLAILSVSANADVAGVLGILDVSGTNPATGQPWAEGDTYRLAFVTSGTRDATSPDIADYHAFVQDAADAAGLGGVAWKCLGQSINNPDRVDNTGVGVAGAEGPVYLLDGVSKLWDVYGGFGGLASKYNITETGTFYEGDVATGSSRKFGDPDQPKIEKGDSGRIDGGAWWQVYNGLQSSQWHFYAVSDLLTVGGALSDPNLPTVQADDDWVTWSGAAVQLSPVVVNNDTQVPQRSLTCLWTASPSDGVVFSPGADAEAPSVTVTKAADTGDATVVTLTLSVTLEGNEPVTDTVMIDVYDNSCAAAKGVGTAVAFDASDFNQDCVTDMADLLILADAWLVNYSLTAPAVNQ